MRRVLLLVPEGLTFDMLTEEQQAAINAIFGQFVLPTPNTKAHEGTVLCDAICEDTFNPANMDPLGISWPIVGLLDWDGESDKYDVVVPVDEAAYLARLNDEIIVDYDEEGSATTATEPPTLKMIHNFAGWPDIFGSE